MTIRLPPELARALRVHCASERRSVANAVTEAVRALLAGAAAGTTTPAAER